MTETQLALTRERLKALGMPNETGPWHVEQHDYQGYECLYIYLGTPGARRILFAGSPNEITAEEKSLADAICALRNDVPALLAELDAAHGIIADMMLDAAPAVEAERQRVLDTIWALLPSRPVWSQDKRCKLDPHALRTQVLGVLGMTRNPLPVDAARREIDRLRVALRLIAVHARGLLDAQIIAGEALGDDPS